MYVIVYVTSGHRSDHRPRCWHLPPQPASTTTELCSRYRSSTRSRLQQSDHSRCIVITDCHISRLVGLSPSIASEKPATAVNAVIVVIVSTVTTEFVPSSSSANENVVVTADLCRPHGIFTGRQQTSSPAVTRGHYATDTHHCCIVITNRDISRLVGFVIINRQ